MQLSERYAFIDKKRREYFEIQYNEAFNLLIRVKISIIYQLNLWKIYFQQIKM